MGIGTRTKKVDTSLEASNIFWGRGQCRTTTFVADIAGSLSGEYFDLNTIDPDGNEKEYYVLLEGSTPPVDPAPAGKTKISVSYTDGDSAATIAGLYVTALASVEVFKVDNGDGTVTVENWYAGSITAEDYTNASSLTLTVDSAGFGGFLGATSDAISFSFETTSVEITADQFGGSIVDEIITGSNASVSANLLEMNDERWEFIFGKGVGDIVEGSSSNVVGLGESKLFANLNDQDGRLTLHPKRLPGTDRSADWVFWRSAPIPSETSFSGTEPQTLAVEFKAFLDSAIDKKVNLVARGDWTQQSDLYV